MSENNIVNSEIITKLEDIIRIKNCLHDRHEFQAELLFVIAINWGASVSDILTLKVSDILTKKNEYQPKIFIHEKESGKIRIRVLNPAIRAVFEDYKKNYQTDNHDSLIFQNYNCGVIPDAIVNLGMPYQCQNVERMLRRTYAYWSFLITRKPMISTTKRLRKMLGLKSNVDVFDFAGITDAEALKNKVILAVDEREVLDIEGALVN